MEINLTLMDRKTLLIALWLYDEQTNNITLKNRIKRVRVKLKD